MEKVPERLWLFKFARPGTEEHWAEKIASELARGFGVQEYSFMLADTAAKQARFKTASEFKRAQLGEG